MSDEKQTDDAHQALQRAFRYAPEIDVFLTELNDFVAYEVEQRFIGKPDSNLFSVTSDDDGNIVITIGNHR